MPDRRELMGRVKKVEREFYAVARAVEQFRAAVEKGSATLPMDTSQGDLVSAEGELEGTYLIRIWAEFETALRSFRRHITGDSDDRIATRNLIDWAAGVKQGRPISNDVATDVHRVREYRNVLVHERDDPEPPEEVTIDVARRRLNIFLQKLPEQW